MKTIIVIKKIMFDGCEIAIDSARSISEAEEKMKKYYADNMPVNAYEITGISPLVRLQLAQ